MTFLASGAFLDSPGIRASVATATVFRVECAALENAGTGFLHKSGKVITAWHVAEDHDAVYIRGSDGVACDGKVIHRDARLDLALIAPAVPISAKEVLQIQAAGPNDAKIHLGLQVSAWGFPTGYVGERPLLTVGNLSGSWEVDIGYGVATQVLVNGAFNMGNSGGPLLSARTADVIGVVLQAHKPLSTRFEDLLAKLSALDSGFDVEGTDEVVSQVAARLIDELADHVQYVLGGAAMLTDLRSFLTEAGIEP